MIPHVYLAGLVLASAVAGASLASLWWQRRLKAERERLLGCLAFERAQAIRFGDREFRRGFLHGELAADEQMRRALHVAPPMALTALAARRN